MANRTGIELLPYVCRIVEIQAGGGLFGLGRSRGGARVRSYYEIPYSPGSPGFLAAELRQLKGIERRATVAVWGLKCRHEAFLLPPAAPADLEAVARREAQAHAGPGASARVADGLIVGELRDGGRREVGYVSVQPDEMRSRLQPLIDGGFTIDRAVTPALAHAALVRHRWSSFPDAVTAVLSVNGRATALTVLRGNVILFARELPWGYEIERAEQADGGHDPSRFAASLVSELRRSFVNVKQQHRVDVTHVLVCGDYPDMRSLTSPLMSELGVEVETLDALDGLDLSHLPESADEFRPRLASLRTAWALAGDDAAPVNLVPREVRAVRITPKLERRHVYAAVAGVIIAAAAWGLITWLGSSSAGEQERLRRELAQTEPEMQRLSEARRNVELASARATALRAFASQGPRIAKVLEAIGRATPPEIALTEFRLEPAVGAWALTVTGTAEGANAAAAQVSFGNFLKALRQSPLLGEPTASPAMSVKTEDPAPPVAEPARQVQAYEPIVPMSVEVKRQAYSGPGYVEVARNGRLYRIPVGQINQQEARMRDEEDRRLRERQQSAVRQERLALAGPPPGSSTEAPGRHPGSMLEFTIKYEVRK